MIAITKPEKEAICKQFKGVHIVRTMKQRSNRHRYYCEEAPRVMKFLNSMRSGNCVTFGGKDANSADRTKRERNKT